MSQSKQTLDNMTREQAKEGLVSPNSGSDAYNQGIKKANTRAKHRINKIFDFFESRTCENCKSFCTTARGKSCVNQENINQFGAYGYFIISNDFGCNRWEQKDSK